VELLYIPVTRGRNTNSKEFNKNVIRCWFGRNIFAWFNSRHLTRKIVERQAFYLGFKAAGCPLGRFIVRLPIN
jgi:hypothetical protein